MVQLQPLKPVLLLFAVGFLIPLQVLPDVPRIKDGILDLRQWDFTEHKIALEGNWKFYEKELLTDPPNTTDTFINFPGLLPKHDIQYATYAVDILLPHLPQKLALDIPQLYSSYKLFVNGELVAENGSPGTSRESTTPQWMPQVVELKTSADTLRLVLQLANFYHYHTGAKQPIYLGLAAHLRYYEQVAVNSNLAECIVLFVLGAAFFLIYYIRQEKKKITLYFSLLCLSWAIRSVFSNLYLAIDFFPHFDWTWMVRIEYITLYSMVIWTVLFFSRLFPKESSKPIEYIFVIGNCTFIAETLIMPPIFFTKWIALYLIVAALVLVHSGVITIRALLKERAGVWYLVFSLVLALILFSYDMIVFEGFVRYYNAILFSLGYIVIFALMAIALFYHLKIFRGEGGSGTLTFDDLYGNDSGKRKD